VNPGILNSPPNYTVYRRDRDDGYGGVTLNTHEITLTDINSELIACRIQLNNYCILLVCSLHRPPSSGELYLENLCQQLTNIGSNFPNAALWIGGDIDWCDGSIVGHSNSLRLNNIFLDFLDNNALSQMVDFPTRGWIFL